MNRPVALLAIASALIVPAVYSLTRSEPDHKTTLTLVSDPYRLDKIYRSMEGPWSIQRGIHVGGTENCKVQWVTGLHTEIIDAGEEKTVSPEFFCHSNLTFAERSGNPAKYNQEMGGRTHLDWRLFTLVPGRLSIDLPSGFGVPIPADAPLDYVTMSLNLNERDRVVNVRMRTTVHTIGADQPGAPTKALFRRALYVVQPSGMSAKGSACMSKAGMHMGAGCGEMTRVSVNEAPSTKPAEGLMNHWIVPPGHHIYTTDVTPQLNLPFDTTIHYATIHVHPFARAMELRDMTAGKTIFRLHSQDWPDRVGVGYVEEFKSIEGIPIQRDHRYELSAEYDNTLDADTDAMAILYVYLLEKDLS